VTVGWCALVWTGSIGTIWPMFGIANQLLAVLALALVTTWLVNTGRGRYAFVTILPMLWVMTTTLTAGKILIFTVFPEAIDRGRALMETDAIGGQKAVVAATLNIGLTGFVITTVLALVIWSMARWLGVMLGLFPTRNE
jgi:carbon starvation protein